MTKTLAPTFLALLLGSCRAASPQDDASRAPEQQIRALLDRWQTALENRDLKGVMSAYLPDKNMVAYLPTSTLHGSDALAQDYANYFAKGRGPLHSELRDLHIVAGPTVAFAYYVQVIDDTRTDGTGVRVSLRITQGYRFVNGRWYAVHDNVSIMKGPEEKHDMD